MERDKESLLQEILEQCWLCNSYGGVNQLQYEIDQCLIKLNKVRKELRDKTINTDSVEIFNQVWSKVEELKAVA